jgi:hypothetical protein
MVSDLLLRHLTLQAEASPRDRRQPLPVYRISTLFTLAIGPALDSLKGVLNQGKSLKIPLIPAKLHLLQIRANCSISDIPFSQLKRPSATDDRLGEKSGPEADQFLLTFPEIPISHRTLL